MMHSKRWNLGALLATALVAAGCGGGGGGGSGAPLAIVSTSPADGEVDVADDSAVFVVFAADLDPASIECDGLMSRAAWEVLRDALREAAAEPEGVPGMVVTLQTFGSYGANFSPHLHVIATEGVLPSNGRFHPVIWPGKRDLEEPPLPLPRSPPPGEAALGLVPRDATLGGRSGFSVDAPQRVGASEETRPQRLARYPTRASLVVGAVRERPDGRIGIDTPPDPKTGSTVRMLDRLDFVHAVGQRIDDSRQGAARSPLPGRLLECQAESPAPGLRGPG